MAFLSFHIAWLSGKYVETSAGLVWIKKNNPSLWKDTLAFENPRRASLEVEWPTLFSWTSRRRGDIKERGCLLIPYLCSEEFFFLPKGKAESGPGEGSILSCGVCVCVCFLAYRASCLTPHVPASQHWGHFWGTFKGTGSHTGLLLLRGQQGFLTSTSWHAHTLQKNMLLTCHTHFRAIPVQVLAYPPVTDYLGISYCHVRKLGLWITLVMQANLSSLLFFCVCVLYWNPTFPSGKSKPKSHSFSQE